MKENRRLSSIGVEIIEDTIDYETGEIDVEKFDALEIEFNDKAGRCIAFMKKRKFQADMCDAEIKRLKAEIKAVEAEKKSYDRDRLGK